MKNILVVSLCAGLVWAATPPAVGEAAGQSNDSIANASTFTLDAPLDQVVNVEGQGSNAGATTEAGEPTGCGRPGASLWYALDVVHDGSVTAYANSGWSLNGAAGPPFTIDLALYSGDPGHLNLLECSTSDNSPQVFRPVRAGRYWVQLAGEQGATGNFRLVMNAFNHPQTGLPAGSGANLSGALVDDDSCLQHQLDRNDDGSTEAVALPFSLNFYGRTYSTAWINNNGNLTFDGPQSTFTPFGVTGSTVPIIAPFFADVDTRGSGSDVLRYGYGDTVYQGHRALCVNWVNVGYYSFHTDKLNSIQLLLVDRSDVAAGAFDIVFNYGSVQWETGDASGGSGGFGGTPARAGFSNGNAGAPSAFPTSYELPYSGETSALLDGTSTGLIHSSVNSDQPGRYVFTIRGGAPATKYVAIGDSYSSGEGTEDYIPPSDSNGCHRSPHAYPRLLVDNNVVPYYLTFVACSGAKTGNVLNGQNGEPSQLDALGEDTALVTLGVGGDDLDFADVLEGCLYKSQAAWNPFTNCQRVYGNHVSDLLLDVLTRKPEQNGLNRLQYVIARIQERAPHAKIVVIGYPRLFPEGGTAGALDKFLPGIPEHACYLIRESDQRWIDQNERQLNGAIAASARSMGAQYVDVSNASSGHELCAGGSPDFFNGIKPSEVVGSFHPTHYGQQQIANAISINGDIYPDSVNYGLNQDQTLTTTTTLGQSDSASFNTSWPGSDIEMTLTSPSGRVIDRASTASDIYHRNGATSETYVLNHPEAGVWTIRLRGLRVSAAGGGAETVKLAVNTDAIPNQLPHPSIGLTQAGRTVNVDAAASSDSDGSIVGYHWEFGDGAVADGRTATHTYAAGATPSITLTVTDDDGGLGFVTTADLTFPRYTFSGFYSPVDNSPTINTVKAGSAIPVKFGLAGAQGLNIFAAGNPTSQRINCATAAPYAEIEETVTAGNSSLTYDAGTSRYHYVWKSSSTWSGTCRRLTLVFDDGTRRSADFKFR